MSEDFLDDFRHAYAPQKFEDWFEMCKVCPQSRDGWIHKDRDGRALT